MEKSVPQIRGSLNIFLRNIRIVDSNPGLSNCNFAKAVAYNIDSKRPGVPTKGVLLYQENVPVHKCVCCDDCCVGLKLYTGYSLFFPELAAILQP